MSTIEDRLDRLESLVEQQQETIEDQQETIRKQRERIADLEADNSDGDENTDDPEREEADDPQATAVNRRTALKAGGLLAALGLGTGATAGTASADPSGQIGTSSDPLQALYTADLYGNGSIAVQEPLDFTNSNSIQDAGTDAITFDGNQNVTIPSGNLDMNGNDLVNVGSISGGNSLWEDAGDDGLLNPSQTGDTGIGVTDVNTDTLVDNGSGQVSVGTTLTLGSNNVTDVGTLSGTTVNTDTLAPNTSGSVTLAGALNGNGFDITNVGTVNGVSVSNHASRHVPSGSDPLATQSPVTLGTSNAEGTADAFARADHVHAHGDLDSETGGGSPLHSLATTSKSGFLSPDGKSKLNNLASDASSAYVNSSGDTVTGDLVLEGSSLDLRNGASIADAGTDAITFDGNQNVTLPNGDLRVFPSADSATTLDVQDQNGNSLLSADTTTRTVRVFDGDASDSVDVRHDGGLGSISTSIGNLALQPAGDIDLESNRIIGVKDIYSDNNYITLTGAADLNLDGAELTERGGDMSITSVGGVTVDIDNDGNDPDGNWDFSVTRDGGVTTLFTVNDGGEVDINSGTLDLNGNDVVDTQTVSAPTDSTLSLSTSTTNDASTQTADLVLDAGTSDSNDTSHVRLSGGASGSGSGDVQVTNGALDVQTGTVRNTTGSLTLSHADAGNGTSLTLDAGSTDQSLVVSNLPSQENSVLTVDNSGNVGTSTKSSSDIQSYTGAAVYLGTDQTLGSADTDIVVEFDSVQFDTGSNFDTSTNAFTAPQDGYYSVDSNITVNRDSTDNYAVKLEKNGTDIAGARVECTDTERNASLGRTVSLIAGDTIRVVVRLFTSVNNDVIQADSSFSIDLEGQS
jgi:hypothetical protein